MGRFKKPNVPFVQAMATGRRQRPSLIVLESSFTTADSGAAYAVAMTLHRNQDNHAYHFVVDEATTFRCVDEKREAYAPYFQRHALSVLLCDDPSRTGRWLTKSHISLLSQTADLIAELCLCYGIKPRILTSEDLTRWCKWRTKRRGGIVLQGTITQGCFPKEALIEAVEEQIRQYEFMNH